MSVVRDEKTGKWLTRYYIKVDGSLIKKTKKGFETRSDAEHYEKEHAWRVQKSIYTFEYLFERMSEFNRANKITTQKRRNCLKKYAFRLWSEDATKISKIELLEWRKWLSTTELKTATKNDIIGFVKQVFRFGNEAYDLYDPSKVLHNLPKQLTDFTNLNIINYDQFELLISKETDEELKIFFRFLFMTGCRKGEARALYKEDFNGHSVHIYKAMRRYEASLGPTKTRTQRWVELDEETISLLTPLLDRDGKYLFGGETPLCLTTISDHFTNDLKEANLPHMRIHDLRHSNVSMLWAAGVPVPEISKRIGHATPKTTMEVYSHVFDNSQTASLKYLNSLGKSD